MNNTLKSIIDEIINTLNEYDKEGEFIFLPEYTNTVKSSPVTKPTAVFGVKELTFGEGGFGEYLGTDALGNTVKGRKCTAKIQMRLYTPRGTSGYHTGEFFEMIASFLSSSDVGSSIISMSVGVTSSDKVTDCFTALGEISLYAIFHTISGKQKFAASFKIKGEQI